jgi:peptidoglycan-associated lipoprotein
MQQHLKQHIKQPMKKKLSLLVLGLSLASSVLSQGVLAAEPSKQEKKNELIGLSSGAIIGTAIAGPLGGIIAGVFGAMIAEDVNSDKKLEIAGVERQQQQQQLLSLQREYRQVQQDSKMQLASMDQVLSDRLSSELESNIQFRTASSVVEEHYKSQLDLVASSLRDKPKLNITLSGFADQRGDSTYNQALSAQRAINVKSYLIKNGVNSEQVLTHSYGESELVSAGSNSEDNFFERRVVLKLAAHHGAMTAANSSKPTK